MSLSEDEPNEVVDNWIKVLPPDDEEGASTVRCPRATDVTRTVCPISHAVLPDQGPHEETGAQNASSQSAEARPRIRSVRGITDLSGMYTVTFGRSAVVVLLDCMNELRDAWENQGSQ